MLPSGIDNGTKRLLTSSSSLSLSLSFPLPPLQLARAQGSVPSLSPPSLLLDPEGSFVLDSPVLESLSMAPREKTPPPICDWEYEDGTTCGHDSSNSQNKDGVRVVSSQ